MKPKLAWKVSRKRLGLATEVLGLKIPVQVFSSPLEKGVHGYYDWLLFHFVCLSTRIPSSKQMNSALWHELAHAYQFENNIAKRKRSYFSHKTLTAKNVKNMYGCSYRSAKVYCSYWNSPEEQEARAIAEEFAPLLDLTYQV